MDILIGSTDQWVRVRAMTAASAALTGKLAADFAFWYARQGAAPVAITPLVDKSPGDAHADGGVYEEGRGWYWVGVPDAAFATGVPSVGISGTVSGGIVLDAPIRLKYSLQIADAGATAVSRLTAAQAADAVWDEAKSEHTTSGTFGLWLGTKLWNWLGALMGKTADATTRAEINATTAGAGYNETTDSLEAQADDVGLLGTGARAVTFTVTTGGVALQGARVRLYRTGSSDRTGDTDASGQVTLYCDVDATWSYAVTHALYESGSGTVVVDGNEAVAVSLTALSWPDSTEADTVTIRWKVKLGVGRVTAGAGEATVYVRMKSGSGAAGHAYGTRQDSDATDANGYVYFANVPVGGTISAKLGSAGAEKVYEIADDATTPYDMGELIGDA